jgi:hypothetical protein
LLVCGGNAIRAKLRVPSPLAGKLEERGTMPAGAAPCGELRPPRGCADTENNPPLQNWSAETCQHQKKMRFLLANPIALIGVPHPWVQCGAEAWGFGGPVREGVTDGRADGGWLVVEKERMQG